MKEKIEEHWIEKYLILKEDKTFISKNRSIDK